MSPPWSIPTTTGSSFSMLVLCSAAPRCPTRGPYRPRLSCGMEGAQVAVVIIFVAVAMTVLVGFAGLSTDTGMIWITRARLQNSVDAAVLAAAQELPAPTRRRKWPPETSPASTQPSTMPCPGCSGRSTTCSGEADVTFEDGRQRHPGQSLPYGPAHLRPGPRLRAGRGLGPGKGDSRQPRGRMPLPVLHYRAGAHANPDFYAPVAFNNANFDKDGNDDGGTIDVGQGGGKRRSRRYAGHNVHRRRSRTTVVGAVGDVVDTKPGAFDQFKAGWDAYRRQAAAADSACPHP